MSGVRRLSDTLLSGAAAGASSGQVPVLGASGKFAPGSGVLDSPAYATHGLSPLSMRYARAALSRAKAGLGNFTMTVQGTSISSNSSGQTITDNWLQKAAVALAAKTGLGYRRGFIPISVPFGSGTFTADAQWTVGSGWSQFGNLGGSNYNGATAAANNAGVLTFTPTDDAGTPVQVTSFDIVLNPASNGIQYAIDGGSYTNLANSTASNTGTYNRLTVSAGSRGIHTLSIKAGTGGAAYIYGAEAIDSSAYGIRYFIEGQSGVNAPSGTTDSMRVLYPDLVIWEYGTNDQAVQVALSTFTTNVASLMAQPAAWNRPASVLWVPEFPRQTPGTSSGLTLAMYMAILDAQADIAGATVLHMDRLINSYTEGNAAPLSLYGDSVHPSLSGRTLMGSALAALLAQL